MNLVLHEVDDVFLTKLDEFQFTPYIINKSKDGGFLLYRQMKEFYSKKQKSIPTKHYVFFVIKDEFIIGYRYIYINYERQEACLFAIAVDPNHRRHGYAKKLINTAIDFCKEHGVKKIDVPLTKDEEEFYVLEQFYNLCATQNLELEFNISLNSEE